MPVYEYRCHQCGHVNEIIWPEFTGGPEMVKCELCRGPASKVLSTVMHKNKKKGKP